jgi:hypothetical protein
MVRKGTPRIGMVEGPDESHPQRPDPRATIEGLDLSQNLSAEEFDFAYRALGEHGVLRHPRQTLTAQQLKDFSALGRARDQRRRHVPGHAVADYGADEPRLIKRCQVMASRFLPA